MIKSGHVLEEDRAEWEAWETDHPGGIVPEWEQRMIEEYIAEREHDGI
jgi:hypothetical protein